MILPAGNAAELKLTLAIYCLSSYTNLDNVL